MMHHYTLSLQIPDNWAVLTNRLVDQDPSNEKDQSLFEYYYREDLLWIAQLGLIDGEYKVDRDGYNLLAGWYPDGNRAGRFVFKLEKGRKFELVARIETLDINILKAKIELSIRLIYGGASEEMIKKLIE